MENQLAILGKSILFSEQIRRENGSLHTKQKRQATTIEIFKTKHEQQEHTMEALQEQLAAMKNAQTLLSDKINNITADATRFSAPQAALLQQMADFNKDDLAASVKALLEQNKVSKDRATEITNLMVAMQRKQTMHDQQFSSLFESVKEMQTSRSKDEREIWGLGNRITNLSTECNEMKELTDQVKAGMIKLDGFVRDSEQKSEQAMAIARSVQHGQVELVGKLERSMLDSQSTLISSAQLPRLTSGNVANSTAPRIHKHESRFDRAATVDSQTTVSHLEDEADSLPSNQAFVRPESARLVQEKAKTLATPLLTPGRQTRSQARINVKPPLQTRFATKPPFASSIPHPSTQSSDTLPPRTVTRSQVEVTSLPANNVVQPQTRDQSSSSVPSMSSLFAAEDGMLQDESSLAASTSRYGTGTTPELLLPGSKKRKFDEATSDNVEPETDPRTSKVRTFSPAVVGPPEKPVAPYTLQMGRNGKPVVPTKPYKQNRRINMDDW